VQNVLRVNFTNRMKIAELLQKGTSFLHERKTGLLESEVLLAYVLGVGREYLFAHSEDLVDGDLVALYEKYLDRVSDGEPLAYITGEKEFYGLNFYVDKRVLIPRPETEALVEEVLKYLDGGSGKVLDVATGSGCIAVSVAKGCDECEVLALDLSEDALDVARLNVEQHGVEDRVQLAISDLLDVIDEHEEFDVIVANLPYIGEVRNRFVDAATFDYEPKMALFGGEGGLELYEKMFLELSGKNIKFGLLVGEFGFGQSDEMAALLNRFFVDRWQIVKDLAGIERMFVVRG